MEISEEVKEFDHLSNRFGKNTHCIVIFIELMIYQISANSREVVFYDKLMKAWQFKYSYWTANRTLVFTKGWKKFVNSKNPRKGDSIKFYLCKNHAKPAEDFLMIKTQAGSIKLRGKTILS
ncbi:hypothetical protein ACFE04_019482 [Oxalis oulophora]